MEDTKKQVIEGQEITETPKTYTQEEVDALLREKADENAREVDRRVTEAVKTHDRKTAERVREAEKLAQMNEQQKYEYQLEQREKAILEKERALAMAENKNEASKILAEKGLSLALVDFVVAEDAETMNANISLLVKEFGKSVKAEVEKRLGSSSPKKNLPPDEALTKESFNKMNVVQQQALARQNPDLYKSLTGRN